VIFSTIIDKISTTAYEKYEYFFYIINEDGNKGYTGEKIHAATPMAYA
jgi:hypothetical protein